ncbi:hypothetical protein HYU07_05105 [Candidatus Woesearchaeota archaeon]|nr:hypothetical protein [Candidatus Woesearchaeota archaeon]
MDTFLVMVGIDTEPDYQLETTIDGSFKDDTITALVDQLYTVSKLDPKGQHVINRVYKWRKDHLEQLNKEISAGHVLKHQMQLWLRACKGEEGWKDILYTHPVVKDLQTGQNRQIVNLDAKLSDYIFYDGDAKRNTLILEAAYVPVVASYSQQQILTKRR